MPVCFIPNNLPNLRLILATGIDLIKLLLLNNLFTLSIYCSLPKGPNAFLIIALYSFVLVFSTIYLATFLGSVPTLNIASVISFFKKAICSALI